MKGGGRFHEWIEAFHHDPPRGWRYAAWLSVTYPVSIVYGAVVRLNALLFRAGVHRTERIDAVVVCLGNITTGGTGKTPAVIELAGRLRDRGVRTAVISRGYGFRVRGDYLVVSDTRELRCSPGGGPDEAIMTAKKLPGVPVVVAARRARAAGAARELFGAEVIVMDDGYQHHALFRDVNVLVVNAENPVGNGMILPAGPLREPVSGAGRADVLWLVGEGDVPPFVHRYAPGIPVVRARSVFGGLVKRAGGALSPDGLPGRRVMAFSGIARPDRFYEGLGRLGAVIADRAAFPDHHRYSDEDVALLNRKAETVKAEMFITTEKDLARLSGDAPFALPVAALVMGVEASGDDVLIDMILRKMREKTA
jgi:tetraacyldisaccharide 4'-kinase